MVEELIQQYSESLKNLGVDNKIVEHPLFKEVEEVLGYLGLNFSDAASTMILKTGDRYVAIIRRDDCKLNFEKVKNELQVSDVRIATAEEFVSVTHVPVGAARMYTPGLETFFDKRIFEKEFIMGGSGSFTATIKHKTSHLLNIPGSKIVDVADVGRTDVEIAAVESTGKRVYSGVRATGRLHLGNYLGAVKGMLALQESYDCTFSVVDMHVMTTPYDAKTLKDSVRSVILDYLAAGLDPKKCRLEIQSRQPHAELSYYLATIYPLAPLEDLPTFKEKKAQYPKHVTTALLYYPILMAADVLLYKAELVPVGIDQEPHLEVMRECARKFNSLYGDTFPEPRRFRTMGEYVPSLLGKGKMSKTVEGSFINLADDVDTIKRKLAKVPTDSGTTGGDIPKEGGVSSLFSLLALFNQNDMHKKFKQDYFEGKIRYGDLKNYLSEAIAAELQPIQEKRKYYEENPTIVDDILEKSNEECTAITSATMREVKEKMGLSL